MKKETKVIFGGWKVNGIIQKEMPEAFKQSFIKGVKSVLCKKVIK